jgi:hypothetical protein
MLRILAISAILAVFVPLGLCDEPAKDPGTLKDFETLGFSVAPKGGGKARTSMFGLVGEGYKFVYVMDRSGSMGGSGRASLKAVKAELTESLKTLDTVHQFQLIFYNERPVLFNPSGIEGKLAFATDQNKERALRFLEVIQADGGTDHEQALRMATSMRPDVIFLLTDGDEPKLTDQEMERVVNRAAGIIIHTIEFGPGPKPSAPSFLEDLAHRTGGKYVYVDTTKLGKK